MKKTTTRKLTDSGVQKVRCPSDQASLKIRDTVQPGLVLKVDSRGRKSWLFESRHDGRLLASRLGEFPMIGLEEARQLAKTQQTQQEAAATAELCLTLDEFYQHHYWPLIQQQHRAPQNSDSLYRNHIKDPLGALPLDQISAERILSLQQQLQVQKQLQPASVNRTLAVLRAIFEEAIRTHLPKGFENPARSVPKLKMNNEVHHAISEAQMRRLLLELQASPQSEYLLPIIQLLALTGARKREVLDLRWQDIDFEQARWTLPENKSGEKQYKPLSDAALRVLQQQLEHQQQVFAELANSQREKPLTFQGKQRVLPKEDWVFPNPITGQPFGSIYCSWNTARIKAGIPWVRIHDLRHFFATEVINAGHSLYEVKSLLGHAYASTTQRYAHLKQERMLDSVNRITCPTPSGTSARLERLERSCLSAALKNKFQQTLKQKGLSAAAFETLLQRLG